MKKATKRHLKIIDKVGAVILLMVVGVLVGGISFAKGNPFSGGNGRGNTQVYLSPRSGTYTVGSKIVVAVHENSGTTGVYTEQIGFSYPAKLLQFESIDGSTSGFLVNTGLSTGGNGYVQIIRGSTSAITKDQLVAKVTFKAKADGGVTLAFDTLCKGNKTTRCTTVYDVNTQNVIGKLVSASYSIRH